MTIGTTLALLCLAQAMPAQKFEVASVKPSADCSQGGRGGAPRPTSSPERLDLRCQTLLSLIQTSYNGPQRPSDPLEIRGGPAWISTDRYDIQAKAEGAPGLVALRGPMLQALLADRFRLQVHRETKEAAVYALTVGKGGPRRMQPAEDGKCAVEDPNNPQRPAADTHLCGGLFYPSADGKTSDMFGVTMADLAHVLTQVSDRTVVDHTGLSEKYDLHLVPTPPADPAEPRRPGELVDLIVGQLNLKLESAKGSQEVLVIDRVERPSGN